jgi:transposase
MTSEHLQGVEFVIGVDTHKSSYTAAVVSVAGAELERITVASDAFGHKKLLAFAKRVGDGRRLWAIEGSGSFGRGLTTFLLEKGEAVGEIDRPSRPSRRNGAKTDDLDAVRAAREAFARPTSHSPGGGACAKRCACWSAPGRQQCVQKAWRSATSKLSS